MADATIVAIVIMTGVFLLLIITVTREGVDAAIRMWNIMGALTGVAFGAITSFYFTTAVNQQKIAHLEKTNKAAQAVFESTQETAERANERLRTVAFTLEEGKQQTIIPKEQRQQMLSDINEASEGLKSIKTVKPVDWLGW